MSEAIRPCRRPGCGHARHTHGNGACSVTSVSGPASVKGKAVGEGFDHDRVETKCPCPGFMS